MIELYWLPVGAGGHFVRHSSALWERACALREHRSPMNLFHSALVVGDGSDRYAIEMAPVWTGGLPPERGVVAEGPVGAAWAGRFKLFRYEVRCWRGGEIPDAEFAVGGPRTISDDAHVARAMIADTASVPIHVWGRDPDGCGDMWNSNSLVSWLLVRAGLMSDAVGPPDGGRAPGWDAGLRVAAAPTSGPSSTS